MSIEASKTSFFSGGNNMADNVEADLDIEDTPEFQERLSRYFQLAREMTLLQGAPIAECDPDSNKVYLLWPDGRKEYLDD